MLRSQQRQLRRRRVRFCASCLYGVFAVYIGVVLTLLSHLASLRAFGKIVPAMGSTTADNATGHVMNITNPSTDESPCILDVPDVGFKFLPTWEAPEVVDFWVFVIVIITLVRFLLSEHGLTIVRRWLLCGGTVSLLRGIAAALTAYPTSERYCLLGDDLQNVFWAGFVILTYQTSTCSDAIFSLHTSNLMLCLLVWLYYLDTAQTLAGVRIQVNEGIVKGIVLTYVCVGLLFVLMTRSHFTANVAQNILLTAIVWCYYHNYIELITIRRLCNIDSSEGSFSRLVSWIESDAEDLDDLALRCGAVVERLPASSSKRGKPRAVDDGSSEEDPEYDSAFRQAESPSRLQGSSFASPLPGYQSFGPPRD